MNRASDKEWERIRREKEWQKIWDKTGIRFLSLSFFFFLVLLSGSASVAHSLSYPRLTVRPFRRFLGPPVLRSLRTVRTRRETRRESEVRWTEGGGGRVRERNGMWNAHSLPFPRHPHAFHLSNSWSTAYDSLCLTLSTHLPPYTLPRPSHTPLPSVTPFRGTR